MAMPQPYAADDDDTLEVARLKYLEREVELQRATIRSLEQALKTAGRVLQPYLSRTPPR